MLTFLEIETQHLSFSEPRITVITIPVVIIKVMIIMIMKVIIIIIKALIIIIEFVGSSLALSVPFYRYAHSEQTIIWYMYT